MIRIKRVYEPRAASDGTRILIDRLWPRGLTKRKAGVDAWMKDIAPSTPLRRWFNHDPARWVEFTRRYRRELRTRRDLLRELTDLAGRHRVTLVYGARDQLHNDAVVLAAVVRTRLKARRSRRRARAKRT